MPRISKRFVIAAPAAAAWEVIGPGFARIGDWATAIPSSTGLPHEANATGDQPRLPRAMAPGLIDAPVTGRVCATGLAMIPEVTETLVAYDEHRRSLTYEAAGMPSFVTVARNTWTVRLVNSDSCEVTLDAHFDTRGVVGTLARWVMMAQLGRTSQHLGVDLRHMVEHGVPSPRKQRQLQRARPRERRAPGAD